MMMSSPLRVSSSCATSRRVSRCSPPNHHLKRLRMAACEAKRAAKAMIVRDPPRGPSGQPPHPFRGDPYSQIGGLFRQEPGSVFKLRSCVVTMCMHGCPKEAALSVAIAGLPAQAPRTYASCCRAVRSRAAVDSIALSETRVRELPLALSSKSTDTAPSFPVRR